MREVIYRDDALYYIADWLFGAAKTGNETVYDTLNKCFKLIEQLPPAKPERMTNSEWVDLLSAQFNISRTSAKEMLHRMMRCKKEDNFKKDFYMGPLK